ncbi:ABC transporter ATP-binding protein [Profundibacter sp.]
MTALLQVKNLTISFKSDPPVVDDVSFSVNAGETLALVGESGSGKTLSCRAILQLLPKTANVKSQGVFLNCNDAGALNLSTLPRKQMRDIRGNQISMIFQEPMQSLSPLHRIGNQVSEILTLHKDISNREAKAQVLEQFERVGFHNPERVFRAYPFELSGGMRQRAMIAMATVAKPDLLIADEPTTALDVTTQAQVLGLIKELQKETGMSVIFVTHDLGVVANMADSVVVLNRGRVMEAGRVEHVIGAPAHKYTQKLFAAAPVIPAATTPEPPVPHDDPILEMESVSKTYHVRAGSFWSPSIDIKACRDINLSVARGKTLAVVGESGSGKTTCARMVLGAEKPDEGGRISFCGEKGGVVLDVNDLQSDQCALFRQQLQPIFQDPYSSFNPRMRVVDALTEPLDINNIGNRSQRRDRAVEVLEWVGLDSRILYRYPHAFSGGQRQRLSIARALAMNPVFLVCDEPTSALDVSVQDQILCLFEDLQKRMGLSYLFISHDLAVVSRIADEVAVMHRGQVVEQAPPCTLFHNPRHPYTQALLAAQPEPDINRPINLDVVAKGAGSADCWPEMFRPIEAKSPPLTEIEPGHRVRCHA